MFKIDLKSCLRIGGTIFGLYLCIFYWSDIASGVGGFIKAISPVIIGAAFAYPLNILMSFYDKLFL